MAKKVLLKDHDNVEVLPITRGELVLDSSGNQAFHSNEFLATASQPGLTEINYEEVSTSNISNTPNEAVKVIQVQSLSDKVYPVTSADAVLVKDDNTVVTLSDTLDYIKLELPKYLPLTGGTLTGALTSQNIIPATNTTYNLGSATYRWANVYATTFTGNATSASTVYVNTSATNSYYPMPFVTSTGKGNKELYIDSSTGPLRTSDGIRYNPSSNACCCSGGFYELSDERLKNFGDDIEVDLDKLSKLSKKYFTWKNGKSNAQHIGVSAQEVQELYPEIVNVIDENGTLSVAYDKLSVVALAAIEKLYEEIKTLKDANSKLEDRISKLENFIIHGN